MVVRFTSQGCKVETLCTIQPNGTYTESIELSVDPASNLTLALEERASFVATTPQLPPKGSSRVRATKFGFELVPERKS